MDKRWLSLIISNQPRSSLLDTRWRRSTLKVVFWSLAGKLVYFPVNHKGPEPKTGKKTTWEGRRGKGEEIYLAVVHSSGPCVWSRQGRAAGSAEERKLKGFLISGGLSQYVCICVCVSVHAWRHKTSDWEKRQEMLHVVHNKRDKHVYLEGKRFKFHRNVESMHDFLFIFTTTKK